MSRYFSFWYLIISLFFIAICFSLISFNKDLFIDFQNRRLNAVMNSASDAAITVIQEQLTINPEDEVIINPDDAWKTYKKIFMNSYDMIGEIDDLYFEYHTPVAMLVVDDGYYVKMPATGKINNSNSERFEYVSPNSGDEEAYENFEYRWSPKIPFARDIRGETFTDVEFTSESGHIITKDISLNKEYPIIVLDTLTGENIMVLDYNDSSVRFGNLEIDEEGNIVATPETENFRVQPQIASNGRGFELAIRENGRLYKGKLPVHNTTFIAETLVNMSTYMINQNRSLLNNNSFYVPVQFRDDLISSVSSFKGMTLIVMVQDIDPYTVGVKANNHSISASQLVKHKNIYCYILNGEKLYGYGKPKQGDIKIVVATPQDAATLGYKYDYKIGGH